MFAFRNFSQSVRYCAIWIDLKNSPGAPHTPFRFKTTFPSLPSQKSEGGGLGEICPTSSDYQVCISGNRSESEWLLGASILVQLMPFFKVSAFNKSPEGDRKGCLGR